MPKKFTPTGNDQSLSSGLKQGKGFSKPYTADRSGDSQGSTSKTKNTSKSNSSGGSAATGEGTKQKGGPPKGGKKA